MNHPNVYVAALSGVLSLFIASTSSVKAAVDYELQELLASVATPMAMNNKGQLVGRGYLDHSTGQWIDQAWVYSPIDGLRDLGIQAAWNSIAVGINDKGSVIGRRWPDEQTAGFLYRRGQIENLPYPQGTSWAKALAISPDGEVIEAVSGNSGQVMARRSGGQVTVSNLNIGNVQSGPCGEGAGVAVNRSGQVATTVSWYASRIEPDNTRTDLGAGYASRADAINRRGDVAGINERRSAFLYTGGTLTWLPKPAWASNGFSVWAMNDRQQIVGGANSTAPCQAFVWSPKKGLINLNTTAGVQASGLHLEYAFGIDEDGRIAAQGTNAAGEPRLVMLTPR
jgi:hypothetical protein